jgi:hypothetical protein
MTGATKQSGSRFAVCISNEGYATSLVMRRLYEVLPDREATLSGLIRVIDESGEDYLYPVSLFEEIELPSLIREKLRFR